MDKVDPKTGLPRGFKWKLKCPIIGANLETVDHRVSYCGQCHKNVYQVRDDDELKERLDIDDRVQYMIETDTNSHFPALLRALKEMKSDDCFFSSSERLLSFEQYSKLTMKWQREAFVKTCFAKIRQRKDEALYWDSFSTVNETEYRALYRKQRELEKKACDPNYPMDRLREEWIPNAQDLEVMLAMQESKTKAMRKCKQIMIDYLKSIERQDLVLLLK